MDFLQLAKERYSVRVFSDKKVEREKLDLILEAGRVSPTAANFQPQRILVLQSEESLKKVDLCTKCRFGTSLVLLICYDKGVSWKNNFDGRDIGPVDASIVTTHMMCEIAALGLGTTWVGAFDPAKVREVFELEDYLEPVAMLPIGYPKEDAKPSNWHYNRLPMNETVYFESFDGIKPGTSTYGKSR